MVGQSVTRITVGEVAIPARIRRGSALRAVAHHHGAKGSFKINMLWYQRSNHRCCCSGLVLRAEGAVFRRRNVPTIGTHQESRHC